MNEGNLDISRTQDQNCSKPFCHGVSVKLRCALLIQKVSYSTFLPLERGYIH